MSSEKYMALNKMYKLSYSFVKTVDILNNVEQFSVECEYIYTAKWPNGGLCILREQAVENKYVF